MFYENWLIGDFFYIIINNTNVLLDRLEKKIYFLSKFLFNEMDKKQRQNNEL